MACCAEYPVPTVAVAGLKAVLVIESCAAAATTVKFTVADAPPFAAEFVTTTG
jgi:hypothetical protein